MMGHNHIADRIALTLLVLAGLVLAGVGVGTVSLVASPPQADTTQTPGSVTGGQTAWFAFPIDNVTVGAVSPVSVFAFPIDNVTIVQGSSSLMSAVSPLAQDMDPYALEQDMEPY